jgi:hypothetical protein
MISKVLVIGIRRAARNGLSDKGEAVASWRLGCASRASIGRRYEMWELLG